MPMLICIEYAMNIIYDYVDVNWSIDSLYHIPMQ